MFLGRTNFVGWYPAVMLNATAPVPPHLVKFSAVCGGEILVVSEQGRASLFCSPLADCAAGSGP